MIGEERKYVLSSSRKFIQRLLGKNSFINHHFDKVFEDDIQASKWWKLQLSIFS